MTAPMQSPHIGDDRLDDFVDGLLDPSAREATAAHLANCAFCSARLDELRALLTGSAEMRRPVAPPAELWPLVVSSTVEWRRVRRQVLRSLNAPLAVGGARPRRAVVLDHGLGRDSLAGGRQRSRRGLGAPGGCGAGPHALRSRP
jgi:Predicted transmembrane transcriptional regulator (anti-sigma factor)